MVKPNRQCRPCRSDRNRVFTIQADSLLAIHQSVFPAPTLETIDSAEPGMGELADNMYRQAVISASFSCAGLAGELVAGSGLGQCDDKRCADSLLALKSDRAAVQIH